MIKYLTAAVLLMLATYGAIEAWPLVAGPSLSINAPQDGASVSGGMLTIAGRAARAASLTLNGAPLLREENGNFSSTLTFPRGGTILTFVATDRFGKTVRATRSIFVPF